MTEDAGNGADAAHKARVFNRRARRSAELLAGAVMLLALVLACSACTTVGAVKGIDAADRAAAAFSTSATPDTSRTPSMPASHTVWTIGTSVQGRPIVAETFGQGSRRVLIVGGIHGNEFGGPVAEAFLSYVRAHPSVVPSGTELDIVPFANPDGQSSNSRANARNVDINRNFPARDWSRVLNRHGTSPGVAPGSEPETQALLMLLDTQHYARVVSLHSHGGLIDWDGARGWTLARHIGRAAHVRLVRLTSYDGSMGSLVPERYHIPVVTWELSRSSFDWRIREGLLAALR